MSVIDMDICMIILNTMCVLNSLPAIALRNGLPTMTPQHMRQPIMYSIDRKDFEGYFHNAKKK